MKDVYKFIFWSTVVEISLLILWAWGTKNLSLIKDIGLPLAALLFTVGNLWLEEKKHLLERKDKYWDKRFKYYSELHQLVGIINYELVGEDLIPQRDGASSKDTKLGKIYKSLQELEDEGEILFNNSNISKGANISLLIKKMREKIKSAQTISSNQLIAKHMGNIPIDQQFASNLSCAQKDEELRVAIEAIFEDCKKRIFSYLKLE